MKTEIKQCQNCNSDFTIESEDFTFYEKIKVPPPTFCPDCRSQRRSAFRNESTLYKRPCDLCKKSIVSMYHADVSHPVYCPECWWSDKWDALEYGQGYDFSKPFFEQFYGLMNKVPHLSLIGAQNTNSEYGNYCMENKNCYLVFGGHYNEDSMYSWYNYQDKDCVDTLDVNKSELVYEGNFGSGLYKCGFVEYAFDSNECYFGYDLRGCNNCFFSTNLRNKSYHIFNKPYSKEEYFKKIAEFDTGSYAKLEELKKEFLKHKPSALRVFTYQKNSVNCVGDDIEDCKNITHGFHVEYSEYCKYAFPKITKVFDSMDISKMGYDRAELCYETIGCTALNNGRFGNSFWQSHDCEYGSVNFSSHDIFGCISLKHKSYCIFNKQYPQDEFEKLRARIVEHMKEAPYVDKKGREYRYGEFFPIELSPFAYNESVAPDGYPLDKDMVLKNGYRWRDPEAREYQKQAYEIPDHIKDVGDDILDAVLACIDCGKNYRIIKPELAFYRQQNFPIPRKCVMCRHRNRTDQRNPLRLWHRRCMCDYKVFENTSKHSNHTEGRCPNEFETSYAPERSEVVYCKPCYQNEIV